MKKCSMLKKMIKLNVKKKIKFQNQTRKYHPIQIVIITMLRCVPQMNGQKMITFMIVPQEIQILFYVQWILENITSFYRQLLVRIKHLLVFSKITILNSWLFQQFTLEKLGLIIQVDVALYIIVLFVSGNCAMQTEELQCVFQISFFS